MYLIYSIHCESSSLSIINAYPTFKECIEQLRSDVIDYLTKYKGIQNAISINKKAEARTATTDGYFLKASNKYPNRISVYQRTSRDIGYIMSNMEITVKRLMVFSSIEFSASAPQNSMQNYVATPLKDIPKVPFMEDLMKTLQERRKTMEGKND